MATLNFVSGGVAIQGVLSSQAFSIVDTEGNSTLDLSSLQSSVSNLQTEVTNGIQTLTTTANTLQSSVSTLNDGLSTETSARIAADSALQTAIDTKASVVYVDQKVADLVDTAPETLNTLNELANALNDDPSFSTSITTLIGQKANTTDVNSALALKADTADVDSALALKADTSTVNSALALKADTSTVNSALALKADTSTVNNALALKADQSSVDSALALKANTSDVDSALALKADQSDVDDALALKADTAVVNSALALKADTSAVTSALALKADTSAVNSALALKADQTMVDSALALKADQTMVDGALALKADTSTVNSALALKADTSTVNSALALKADTSVVNSALALKADQTIVDGISSSVQSLTTDLSDETAARIAADSALQTAIDTKASVVYVDQKVADLVDSAPETLNTLNELAQALNDDPSFSSSITTLIGQKADTSTVNSALALKADTSVVNSALALKADTSTVNSALALKADTSTVNSALALKADAGDVTSALALKADASTVSALSSSLTAEIDARTTEDAVLQASITGLQNGKVSKSGDTMSGNLVSSGYIASGNPSTIYSSLRSTGTIQLSDGQNTMTISPTTIQVTGTTSASVNITPNLELFDVDGTEVVLKSQYTTLDVPALTVAGQPLSSGGGSSVAGTGSEVQFKDGSALGADSTFTFNKTTDTLSVANVSVSGTITNAGLTSTLDGKQNVITSSTDLSVRDVTTSGTVNFGTGRANQVTYQRVGTNVALSTTQIRFGTASLGFSNVAGSSLRIHGISDHAPDLVYNGTWTVEMWFYPTQSVGLGSTWQALFSTQFPGVTTAGQLILALSGTTRIPVIWANNGGGNLFANNAGGGTTAPALNEWSHIAYVREGTNYSIYMNGSRVGVISNATNVPITAFSTLWLGGQESGMGMDRGWIDEVRVSFTARYTGTSYTVPTGPFTHDSFTAFLHHFNGANNSIDFENADQETPLRTRQLLATSGDFYPRRIYPRNERLTLSCSSYAGNTSFSYVPFSWNAVECVSGVCAFNDFGFVPTSSTIIMPETGVYAISCHVRCDIATAFTMFMQLRKNNVVAFRGPGTNVNSSSGDPIIRQPYGISCILFFVGGESFDVGILGNASSAGYGITTSNKAFLEIHRIA